MSHRISSDGLTNELKHLKLPASDYDHSHALEYILTLEEALRDWKFTIEGHSVWPIIRLWLWSHLLNPNEPNQGIKECRSGEQTTHHQAQLEKDKFSTRKILHLMHLWSKLRLHNKSAEKSLKKAGHRNQRHILVISRRENHQYVSGKEWVDTNLDPVCDLLEEMNHSVLKVEMASFARLDQKPISQYRTSHFLNWPFQMREEAVKSALNRILFRRVDLRRNEITKMIDALNQLLPERLQLPYKHLENFRLMCRVWRRLLKGLDAKAVITNYYYRIHTMACIQEAKNKTIPTMDIQHGKQGRIHAMYTHWKQLPEKSYAQLPHYFWVWGQESANNISSWISGNCKEKPQTLVGGNLWLAQCKHNSSHFLLSAEQTSFVNKLQGYERVILLTLQHKLNIVPEFVYEAMRESPEGWIWLVRMHPVIQKDSSDAIEAFLLERGCQHFEIKHSSNMPLYALLPHVSHHLTGWSSVCYEAQVFEVPTIFISSRSLKLYENYLNKGIFHYANNAQKLLNYINKESCDLYRSEDTAYINCDVDAGRTAINYFLQTNVAPLQKYKMN